jgi:hypothetical protein
MSPFFNCMYVLIAVVSVYLFFDIRDPGTNYLINGVLGTITLGLLSLYFVIINRRFNRKERWFLPVLFSWLGGIVFAVSSFLPMSLRDGWMFKVFAESVMGFLPITTMISALIVCLILIVRWDRLGRRYIQLIAD